MAARERKLESYIKDQTGIEGMLSIFLLKCSVVNKWQAVIQ